MSLNSGRSSISWEHILTSLEEGVMLIDSSGRISFLNQACESVTELPAAQTENQPYISVFEPNPWISSMIGKSLAPEQSTSRGEGEFLTRRGRKVPVSATASPLLDQLGTVQGTVLLLRDLTRRKELEEDSNRSERLAMLGTLAAGLAHEIKNPLGGIRGAAQLLKREFGKEPSVDTYTQIMIREADRVNQLIDQLLDLSHPGRLDLAALNIHEVLDSVLLLEAQTVEEGKVRIKKNYDPSIPNVCGDRNKLVQVFLNLVKNACQAMEGEGNITITTRVETGFHIREQGKNRKKFIWVDIEDDGPGIKVDVLPHIFSPFFTTKNNGTGLGLAICYRIIQEHGGLIRVQNRKRRGSIFKVSLRVAE